jgi:hypothetical protein
LRSSAEGRAAAAYHIGGLIPLGRHAAGGESAIVLFERDDEGRVFMNRLPAPAP